MTGAFLDTIPETIAGRISAPVPLSLGEDRYHRLLTSEWTLDSRKHLWLPLQHFATLCLCHLFDANQT